MKQAPSTPIKIAAFIFLVGGIYTLVVTLTSITGSYVSQELPEPESLAGLVSQIIQVFTIIGAALSVLIGWYLIKLKRWSYILGLIHVISLIVINVLVLLGIGTTRFDSLIISAVILSLLIIGKKDFNKVNQQTSQIDSH